MAMCCKSNNSLLIFADFIMYRYWPVVVGSAVVVEVDGETTTTTCNVPLTRLVCSAATLYGHRFHFLVSSVNFSICFMRESTLNINTKNLRSFITVKAIVQWHIYNSKNHLVSSSTPVGRGCNRSYILHPWPSGVLIETKWFLLL